MIFPAFIVALLVFLTLCEADVLRQPVKSRELGLADIPPCGIQCMLVAVPASGCSLTDANCVCSNQKLAKDLGACMLANCTMADSLNTARVQADLCHFPKESKRTQFYWFTAVTHTISILFTLARFAGKLSAKRAGWDDALLGVVMLLLTIPIGLFLYVTGLGFGNHLWDLEDGRLAQIMKLYFVGLVVYTFAIGMIKIPVILFYLEIFRIPNFVICACVLLAFITASTITLGFVTIFACTPVAAFWNRDIKGKCMNIQAIAYATSASAIIQDLILLVLPLIFISSLQMKKSRKIAVSGMFAIGMFGTIATIIRLHALLKFKVTLDPTWDYVIVVIWTELELCATVVCISLPSIRILLVKIVPRQVKDWFTSVTRSSKSGRSGHTPKPAMPSPWKQPTSWVELSHNGDGEDGSKSSRTSGKAWLEVTTKTSDEPEHSESGVSATRPPQDMHDQVELLETEKSARLSRPARS